MNWNLKKIKFLYPPDNFPGSFTNEILQMKHEAKKEAKINAIIKDLEASDQALSALKVLDSLDHIQFIFNNIEEFRAQKCLEEAVLKLYTKQNSSFESGGIFKVWQDLFRHCDRDRFYSLGTSFPDGEILAFRGSVPGVVKGFSWTVNRKKIDWFTERWRDKSLGGGTIFSTHISRKDILVFLKDEEQAEIIVSPQFLETAKIEEV